jgi:YheC/D like ATP-grasp
MKWYMKWMPEKKDNMIFLPESIIEEREVIPRRMILQVGIWKQEVEVEIHSGIPENTIGLSSTIKLPFQLPEHLPYEIEMKGRKLHLGPVIAFMAFKEERDITPESLNEYKDYLSSYSDIRGLIYICAANRIHSSTQTVEGYYYDPAAKEDETPWKYGFFPYPDVIYRKIDVKKPVYDQITSGIGENMFNSYLFDKWELWQWLSPYPYLREHLPYTQQLKNVQSLDHMLSLYGSVYLKPIETSNEGLFKVDQTCGRYRFVDESAGEKCFHSKEEATEFLNGLITHEDYLIQQAVSAMSYGEHRLDFRVILQKNSSKHWNCSGIIARLGDKTEITANFDRSGIFLTGKEALRKVFQMNEREVFLKEQEMIDLCASACQTLDKCGGNYADLAIDMIIDENLKVWLIEIHPLYDHQLPLYSIKDREMYLKVVTTPFEYAKSLAGFSS